MITETFNVAKMTNSKPDISTYAMDEHGSWLSLSFIKINKPKFPNINGIPTSGVVAMRQSHIKNEDIASRTFNGISVMFTNISMSGTFSKFVSPGSKVYQMDIDAEYEKGFITTSYMFHISILDELMKMYGDSLVVDVFTDIKNKVEQNDE